MEELGKRFLMLLTIGIYLLISSNVGFAQESNYISWISAESNYYQNLVNPVIISDSTIVYAKPVIGSDILRVLKFKSSIKIFREGNEELSVANEFGQKYFKWYEILCDSVKGYVAASAIATHYFSDEIKHADYFIVTDFSHRYNPDANSFTVYKFDRRKNQISDSLEIKQVRGDVVKEIDHTGWKNVDMIFSAEMINAYCGGGTSKIFIVDANNKLAELITVKSNGDDGSADAFVSNVWLPIKFRTGNVLLVADGDVENIFDTYSGKLRTHAFPKELSFPKNELIVYNEIQTGSVYKNGEPLLNKDGSYKSKTVHNITKYYRWNGTKLVRFAQTPLNK